VGRKSHALLKLDHPVEQKPITIAADSGAPETPTRILGWGKTCDATQQCPELPTVLQELDTKLVDDSQCAKFDGKTELCTDSDVPNAQGCTGDSGGPQVKSRPGDGAAPRCCRRADAEPPAVDR
jgi:hypothetical protein